jgi:transposase
MNSRIYSKEVFDREIERLKLGYYYCPECFQNSLTDRIEQLQLFGNYCCKNCGLLLSKNEALTKEKVREIKINKILK